MAGKSKKNLIVLVIILLAGTIVYLLISFNMPIIGKNAGNAADELLISPDEAVFTSENPAPEERLDDEAVFTSENPAPEENSKDKALECGQ